MATNGRQHYNVTLAALTVAGTAFAFQQTMVLPALPSLQRDLHTTTGWATWLLTGFLLVASVATPLLGKAGDQYGKERMLLVSLGVFFLGSLGAIFAWDVASLIAFRMIQGFGGAVFPLSFAIIKDEFPAERVGLAVGIVSSVFGVGGGLGLALSGVVLDHLSWRFLFVFGAIGVGIATVLVSRFVPESPIKTPSRVDVPGAVLLSLGLGSFLVALTEGESWGWSSGRTTGLLAASILLLLAWGAVEYRVREPMVDLRMLAGRTVLLTNLTSLVGGAAIFSSFVLVPNLAEAPGGLPRELARLVDYGLGATTTEVGLYLLPGAITGLVAGPLASTLGRRHGSKWPLALGMLLAAVGLGLLALWHDRPWQIVLGMLVIGFGLPLSFAAMAKLIVDAVRPSETGVATAMNQVMRTVGGVVGGQAAASVLASETIASTSVPAESAFVHTFAVSAVVALVALVLALLVTRLRRPPRLAFAEAGE